MKHTKANNLKAAVKNMKRIYMLRGFRGMDMHMDGEFKCLRGKLTEMCIRLNIVSSDEHVLEADWNIRIIKDMV